MNVLKANNIIKFFKDPEPFKVLDSVNFEVRKGEFLSVVGKSGCGKSTLLYILSTMDTDYDGELMIRGERLTGQKQNYLAGFRNEHLGFVFQFHFLLPEFTALKNVMLPALKLGKFSSSEIEHRAIEKLRLVGMETHAHKLASKLSGGQQQRVAIARALINDPAIIMGDEPTGNLDTANAKELHQLFFDLRQQFQQTFLIVTHNEDLAQLSDRVLQMKDGKIV